MCYLRLLLLLRLWHNTEHFADAFLLVDVILLQQFLVQPLRVWYARNWIGNLVKTYVCLWYHYTKTEMDVVQRNSLLSRSQVTMSKRHGALSFRGFQLEVLSWQLTVYYINHIFISSIFYSRFFKRKINGHQRHIKYSSHTKFKIQAFVSHKKSHNSSATHPPTHPPCQSTHPWQ